MSDDLARLQEWYRSQCNGEWEHSYGLSVDTLDNPGWTVKIDLIGTKAEGSTLQRTVIERSEMNWVQYWTEKRQFHAACGPENLSEAIGLFLDWFNKI